MAEKKNLYSSEVEADRNLLHFDTYEEYTDSFIDIKDLRNLRSIDTARIIVSLGYKSSTLTLTEKDFYRRLERIRNVFHPKTTDVKLSSSGLDIQEPVARALAERELENRKGNLQTVIFIRISNVYESSAYIDYNHRLTTEDWRPIFMGLKKIIPKITDLSYYHWKTQESIYNITKNFEICPDTSTGGLRINNRHDHKILDTNPLNDPGQNTTKTRIYSPLYAQCELYDHILRKKG